MGSTFGSNSSVQFLSVPYGKILYYKKEIIVIFLPKIREISLGASFSYIDYCDKCLDKGKYDEYRLE
jgi:hypothetical protein